MKFIIQKEKIEKTINTINSVISSKTTLPILAYVLIEARGRVKLTATDLEVGIRTEIDCEISREGSATFPGRKLAEIIRELPEGNLQIEAENTVITLSCGKAFFKVYGLPPTDFPLLPEITPENVFSISQSQLKEMFTKTMFAMSEEEARYVLNGIYMVSGENSLKAVATDGRRLAVFELITPEKLQLPGIIIPAKAVMTLQKILEDNENPVQIHYQQNQILFKLDSTVIVSRLIEGNFPNYEQVIPSNCPRILQVATQDLIQAIRRVMLLASERSHAVRFSITKDEIQIFSSTPEIGEARDHLGGQFQGEEMEVTFNGRYLLDALRNIDSEYVRLELSDPLGPGVIRPPEKKDYLCVIMPMRI